jgi:hypothetical protein
MTGDGRGGASNSVPAAMGGCDSTVLTGVPAVWSREGGVAFGWRTGPANDRADICFRAIFIEAHLSDHILIYMLPWAAPGNEMAIERILEIARMAAPRIRIRRGPKVTAASGVHELFLEKHGIRGASAYSYSDLEEDFIDEATQATRLEFPGARFGPRPTSRRLKARRQLAGAWIPRRGARAPHKENRIRPSHLAEYMAISVLDYVGRLDVSRP